MTGAALTKMSTRIKTRGMMSSAQKPNVTHLFRIARRALRRSNSLGAKGLATRVAELEMARSAFMSGLVGLFDTLDDQIGGHVDAARDQEQHDAENEEHAVMLAAGHSLAHLRRDSGGHSSHRVGQDSRDAVIMARGQEQRHGFSYCPAHS